MKTCKTDRNLAIVLAAALGATMAVAGGAAAIETVPSPLSGANSVAQSKVGATQRTRPDLANEERRAATFAELEQQDLEKAEAGARYLAGVGHERRGEFRAALDAYLDAAEGGDPLAKKKLGDIFGTGSDTVDRDYQTSLKWYLKARMEGVEIRNKPIPYPGIR